MILTADLVPVHIKDTYRNRTAFLIAGGPSFATLDHAKLRQPGVLTMAVNNAVKTFRPHLWTCVDDPSHFIRSIWLDPTMLKFCPIGNAQKRVFDSDRWAWTDTLIRDCPSVFFYQRNAKFQAKYWLQEPTFNWGNAKEHGGGRSVLLVAVKLLYYLGIRRIYLLGVDLNMDARSKYHFEQDRAKGSIRGNNDTYRKLQRWFTELRPYFEEAGLRIFNCNPQSRLTAFDHVPYDQAINEVLSEWGSIDVKNERTAGLYDQPKPKIRQSKPSVLAAPIRPASVTPSLPPKPEQITLTLITPTGDRPEAMALLERWMSRQTYPYHQWIVVDDGLQPTTCTMGQHYIRRTPGGAHSQHQNIEAALEHVTGNAIAFIEDDDWYGPGYLAELISLLDRADIAGFGWACKYNVKQRLCKRFNNRRHACLARTAVRMSLIDTLRGALDRRPRYIDMDLWRSVNGRKSLGKTLQHVGMKEMPGRAGIESGHRPSSGWGVRDPEGAVLKELVANDHDVYAAYYQHGLLNTGT